MFYGGDFEAAAALGVMFPARSVGFPVDHFGREVNLKSGTLAFRRHDMIYSLARLLQVGAFS